MERQEVVDYILELTGLTKLNATMVKHLSNFIRTGMTYDDICLCIYYYTEVKQKTIDPIYGLFFVENVFEEAKRYQQMAKEEREKQLKYKNSNPFKVVNVTPRKQERSRYKCE